MSRKRTVKVIGYSTECGFKGYRIILGKGKNCIDDGILYKTREALTSAYPDYADIIAGMVWKWEWY